MPRTSNSIAEPGEKIGHIRQKLLEMVQLTRSEIDHVDEPRARALFETTAEVLEGLAKAYKDYGEGSEAAWRR
jgi:hypothetical protein